MRVVCREWSESELPFQSPEVPSVSVSAPRARCFQEGDFFRARSQLSCGRPINGEIRPSVLQPEERIVRYDDGFAVSGNSGEDVTDFPHQ